MILAAVAAEAETFTGLMDHVAQGFEALGAAILVVGVIWSFVLAAVAIPAVRLVAKGLPSSCARHSAGLTLLLGWRSGRRPRPGLPAPRRLSRRPLDVLALGPDRGDEDVLSFSPETDPRARTVATGSHQRSGNDPPGRASAMESETRIDSRSASRPTSDPDSLLHDLLVTRSKTAGSGTHPSIPAWPLSDAPHLRSHRRRS